MRFTASENMSKEYCCTLVQIGDLKPIEGSDFLVSTLVEGREIVVRKDQVNSGDLMFYAANECELNRNFLSANNFFDDPALNRDNTKKGYINKWGRIRMIKLRGVLSMGFLFSIDDMLQWKPDIDVTELSVGQDFDTVDGELFVCAYVPRTKPTSERASKDARRIKKIKQFDRMIPGQFCFHYDTAQLNREISRLKPTDYVFITNKLHGTSAIFGNIKIKAPKWGGLYSKIFEMLPSFLQFTKDVYGSIYSSRTVIKNRFINSNVGDGFYGKDIWAQYHEMLKPYIHEGYTLYGEICGYADNDVMIQKGYDYGCAPDENFLMLYRITKTSEDGKKHEFNVDEVRQMTLNLISEMRANGDISYKKIRPIDVFYEGALADLYPDLDQAMHWHSNVLEAMKKDARFGMEQDETLCKNKVPREGFVLRVKDDPISEAFKLKCIKFLSKEAKEMDTGAIDIEMEQKY